MASNAYLLIALRVLQGLGAGILMPMSMGLMVENCPPDKRGMGTALWGLGASLGSVIGLPLGGDFADAIDWRAGFYVNLLPGCLGVLGTLFSFPPRRESIVYRLTAVGTQQALALFTRLAGTLGTHVASVQSQALGLLQEVVRREALVHALRDGFYMIVLVGMGSLVLILAMWPLRQR